jgi:RraA family protein
MGNPGFRILPMPARPPRALIEAFAAIAASQISDCMNRMAAGGAPLRPFFRSAAKLCGPAFTVKTAAGDNLLVHKAIDIAQSGDVIVIDAGGDTQQAIIGEIMTSHARKRGVAGFVVHGAIRDSGTLLAGDYPVYACGATPRGPYKDGPGEINVPVVIGGMVVNPGDIIVGDEDGVIVVPRADAEGVLAAAQKKQAAEVKTLRDIAAGEWDRRWVDEALKKLGCDF